MLLRRHKINAVRNGKQQPEREQVQQEELYGDELNYKGNDSDELITYKKSDILRMSVSELREVATNAGAENAENMTGTELKKYLIDVFGL